METYACSYSSPAVTAAPRRCGRSRQVPIVGTEVRPRQRSDSMLGYITDSAAPNGLDRRDLPEPEPTPHQAVIEVGAYAINRGELSLLSQRADGWTPGQDLAGVVVAAAADGTGPSAGTRVVGLADWGGWSERVAVPTHRIAPLPETVTFPRAAALPVAGLTALRTLRTGGALLGRRVLVTGASGGVGSFAVQLARAYGLASGERSQIAFFDFNNAQPGARLEGFRIYTTGEETFGEDLATLAGMVADGRLDPQIGVVRDWSGTVEALDALRSRQATGKVVLTRG